MAHIWVLGRSGFIVLQVCCPWWASVQVRRDPEPTSRCSDTGVSKNPRLSSSPQNGRVLSIRNCKK